MMSSKDCENARRWTKFFAGLLGLGALYLSSCSGFAEAKGKIAKIIEDEKEREENTITVDGVDIDMRDI